MHCCSCPTWCKTSCMPLNMQGLPVHTSTAAVSTAAHLAQHPAALQVLVDPTEALISLRTSPRPPPASRL